MTHPHLAHRLLLSLALLLGLLAISGCARDGGGSSGSVTLVSDPIGATLDGNFGGGMGRVVLAAGVSAAVTVVEDSVGNLVVAGTIVDTLNDVQIAVWRLLPNGDFDPSFGIGGLSLFDASMATPDSDSVCGLIIDATGRIVVAGTTDGTGGDRDIFVARLLSNGAIDVTFGVSGGIAYAGNDVIASHDDVAVGLRVDSIGGVIVVGQTSLAGSTTPRELAAWKFLSIGLLDSGFANSGLFRSGGMDDHAGSILIDSTGAALLVGGRGPDLALWLLTPGGVLEPTFASGGVATVSGGGASLRPNSAAIYGGAALLVVGRRSVPGEQDRLFATRLSLIDGSLDSGFGGNGFLTFASLSGNSAGHSAAVAGGGQIVIAGDSTLTDPVAATTSATGAMWLLAPTGFLDTSLGGLGVVHLSDAADHSTGAQSILIDSMNHLVIAGSVGLSAVSENAVVWRLP